MKKLSTVTKAKKSKPVSHDPHHRTLCEMQSTLEDLVTKVNHIVRKSDNIENLIEALGQGAGGAGDPEKVTQIFDKVAETKAKLVAALAPKTSPPS